MINVFADHFGLVQQWLFENAIEPLMFNLGMGNYLEDAFDGTEWLMVGLMEMVFIVLILGALQRWRPVEPVIDRRSIRVDILYTIIHRLGLFRILTFLTLDPVFDTEFGKLHASGLRPFDLDNLWPGITEQPLVSLTLYLIAFDFIGYWVHRAQHHFEWWWALHSLHHSQRQMTMWTDNRNHFLDDILQDVIAAVTAQLIGVPPAQFIAFTAITQLSESLQHANVRLWFGRWGEYLWVSPRFHRLHHSIGLGHESSAAKWAALRQRCRSQPTSSP